VKALAADRATETVSRPIETNGHVENQIKKARINGMRSHVAKTDIKVIIVQVSALQANKEALVGTLMKVIFDAQIVHLLGQLPGLKMNGGGDVAVNRDDGGRKAGTSDIGKDDDSD
jgi:hypothetical protein